MQTQGYNAELVENLATAFPRRNEASFAWGNAISYALQLHGLRSFWPALMDENGDALDIVRGMTLGNDGNPTIVQSYLMPMFEFNGANYLNRPDEAALRVVGTEAYIPVANRGLTVGFWMIPKANAACVVMGDTIAGGEGWWFDYVGNVIRFWTFGGLGAANIWYPPALTLNRPWFVVGRFTPSTKMDIFVNGAKSTMAVNISASILYGAGPLLEIGGYNGANGLYTGLVGYPFYCAAALSDAVINGLWHLTRPIFGV